MSNFSRKALLLLSALVVGLASASAGIRVLFIGDSITDGGWGNSGGTDMASDKRNHWDQNHIFGHSYMMLCASQLLGDYPEREYQFLNRGISGDDLSKLEKRWQADVIDEHPDILSVMIGTNDVHQIVEGGGSSFDYRGWEMQYRQLLDKAIQANPELKIVLCTTFTAKVGRVGDAASYETREKMIEGVNLVVRRLADQVGAIVVPFDSMMKELPMAYPSQGVSYWCWDGIHPTPAGHRKLADLWLDCTKELFRK